MQFALRGNDRLMQLRIDPEEKSRIFIVQGGKPRGHLVLFTLGLQLECGVNVRARIFRHGKFYGMIRGAKGVAGMGVLEFDRRADVTRAKPRDHLAGMTVEQENLADPFRDVAVGVE